MKADSLQELITWKPPYQSYIIDHGLLLPQTKMIIFGKMQTWKSMLSIHTGFSLALGRPWFGFKTIKAVTYILQIEVPKAQFRERVLKYTLGNQVTSQDIYFSTEHYIKLDRGYGVNELEKELQRINPQVLIVDPLFKVVTGRITDEYDMRQFMDRMDLLMAKYRFALILIHHDRKHQIYEGEAISFGAEDMFGTSIFIDWCDTSVRTSTTSRDGEVILTFEKARHADEELKPITIQIDRSNLTFKRTQ